MPAKTHPAKPTKRLSAKRDEASTAPITSERDLDSKLDGRRTKIMGQSSRYKEEGYGRESGTYRGAAAHSKEKL